MHPASRRFVLGTAGCFAVTNLSINRVTRKCDVIFDGLLPHRLQGVMIKGAPIGRSFASHGVYYRSHDATYGKVSISILSAVFDVTGWLAAQKVVQLHK